MMKKWWRLIWRTKQEQASTLLRLRISVFAKQCYGMERTTMRTLSQPLTDTDVYFALPEEVSALGGVTQFQTIYVISELDDSAIAKLADAMSAGAVLVRYQ
ncbi:hypothetical protein [Streptomyces prunicolor]|uniref:hypothetical protein n=1 Tax=Streptomyces prunicolor TaxID=67348 RepID=UPI001319C2FE|nr:hypothetical protein [Streptomyces prunicolor]